MTEDSLQWWSGYSSWY